MARYLIVLVLALLGAFYALNAYIYSEKQEGGEVIETVTLAEAPITFSYRTSPYGYRLDLLERRADDDAAYVRGAVLMLEDDFASIAERSEAPPTMAVSAYRNERALSPLQWAETYPQFSNLPLAVGTPESTTIAGAPALRFMADGLYRMDTAIVASGEHIYVLSGGFLDADSLIRRDFETFISTITFADGGNAVENPEPVSPPSASAGPSLDLSGTGLSRVPTDLFSRTDLVRLDLSDNALTGALPAEVRQLSKLEELDLSGNDFTGVPAEVGQLSRLVRLDLSDNPLTGLPYELGNLSALRELDLRGTRYSKTDLDIIRAKIPQATILTD